MRPQLDFLPIVKGKNGGAVTPPGGRIRIQNIDKGSGREFLAIAPDLLKPRAVLVAVKIAARRRRRWPSANLDRHCARRDANFQAGTEKQRFSRTEKL